MSHDKVVFYFNNKSFTWNFKANCIPTTDQDKEQIEPLDTLEPLFNIVYHKLILSQDMNYWLQPEMTKYGDSDYTKIAQKLNEILYAVIEF